MSFQFWDLLQDTSLWRGRAGEGPWEGRPLSTPTPLQHAYTHSKIGKSYPVSCLSLLPLHLLIHPSSTYLPKLLRLPPDEVLLSNFFVSIDVFSKAAVNWHVVTVVSVSHVNHQGQHLTRQQSTVCFLHAWINLVKAFLRIATNIIYRIRVQHTHTWALKCFHDSQHNHLSCLHHVSFIELNTIFMIHTGGTGRWSEWMAGVRNPGLSRQNPCFASSVWISFRQ